MLELIEKYKGYESGLEMMLCECLGLIEDGRV